MNSVQEQTIHKLRQQQDKCPDGSPARFVAAQLVDICRNEPASAEILLPDLDNPDMDVIHAERQIKALADEKHKASHSSCVCVTPDEAETALRKFYGLPAAHAAPVEPSDDFINLLDFL